MIRKNNNQFFSLIKEFFQYISLKRRKQIILILFIIILSSFSEILSLGAVVPFLEVVTNPEKYWESGNIQMFINFFEIQNPSELILPATLIFSLTVTLSALLRLLNLWLNTFVAAGISSEISTDAYKKTLYQDYKYHLNSNTSKTIAASTSQSLAIYIIIGSVLTLVAYSFIAISIYITLVLISWEMAIVASLVFISAYFALAKFLQPKISRNSNLVADLSEKQIKIMQEGLGAVRDILLDSNQEMYVKFYKDADLLMRIRNAQNSFFSSFPRHAFEALGLVLIAIIALISSRKGINSTESIIILGVFALGAQRLLPALQQIYGSWALIKSYSGAAEKILQLLRLKVPIENFHSSRKYDFKESIKLKNISFKYDSGKNFVIKNFNMEIIKGNKIGFIGKTGSGKSTLIDIIIGLLKPTSGNLLIDDKNLYGNKLNNKDFLSRWKSNIAYVPQNIYLSDSTFKNNIAFGLEDKDIDMELVKKSAKIAQISTFIEKMPYSYDSYIGERGVRLSGGQRQRIGIARAIYKQVNILVFDEATSALDHKTEKLIIDQIGKFKSEITVIMIAHRLSTLNICDHIYEIDSNSLKLRTDLK